MKLARASVTLGLMTLTGIASPGALAGDNGWYIGGNVGQSRSTIDDDRIKGGLQSGGFTTTSLGDDNRDIGFKVFGGYQFIPYFALEGGYFNLGKFGFNAATQPAGTLDGKIRLMGLNLDAVGILPIAYGFSALGRIGVAYTQARDTFAGTGARPQPRQARRQLQVRTRPAVRHHRFAGAARRGGALPRQ
jgi:OOP family OmpA-OmpF porin